MVRSVFVRSVFAAAAALTVLAPSAWANYNVKAKIVCADVAGDKLTKVKLGNDDVIAACLGVAPTDPSVADYALTFDSDTRELHVLRRCDSLVVCDLSDQIACQTAGTNTKGMINTTASCAYRMLDIVASKIDLEGTLVCKEREKWNATTDKYSFSTSCDGTYSTGGSTPCTISLKSGKLFDESGVCPVSAP